MKGLRVRLVLAFAILAVTVIAYASTGSTMQPVADSLILPAISRPAYAPGEGPVVMVDEGHYNFHVFEGSDRPFLEYLRRDGYRVQRVNSAFTPESLLSGSILVIPMPLSERNRPRGDATDWSRPHPSAFTDEEIAAVHDWVADGGALLVVADHPPLVGAVAQLATVRIYLATCPSRGPRPSDMERPVNPFRYLRVTSKSGHVMSVAIERLLRRLITLIYAGRDRMVVIRRELPRTKRAGPARRPAA